MKNNITPQEAVLALAKCKELEKTIDRIKIQLMKAARPKLELVKDDDSTSSVRPDGRPSSQ